MHCVTSGLHRFGVLFCEVAYVSFGGLFEGAAHAALWGAVESTGCYFAVWAPPPSSVRLQHEVTEALQAPVLPDHHLQLHHGIQPSYDRQSQPRWHYQQGQHQHQHQLFPSLLGGDLHVPLAPGASSMVLNLEGFEVLVDVALLGVPGLKPPNLQHAGTPNTSSSSSSSRDSRVGLSTLPLPLQDDRVIALLCHGPDRLCFVHGAHAAGCASVHEADAANKTQDQPIPSHEQQHKQQQQLLLAHRDGSPLPPSSVTQLEDQQQQQQRRPCGLDPGSRILGMQHPCHLTRRQHRIKGDALWMEGVLRRLGWRVLRVPYWEWPNSTRGGDACHALHQQQPCLGGLGDRGSGSNGDGVGDHADGGFGAGGHSGKTRQAGTIGRSKLSPARGGMVSVRPEVLHLARVAYLRQLLLDA
ncbi:hypothetical protein DUNSADRAFT_15977 [Dunaliella salina]|uniref:RAP domain-containing protein n=1 Tax=Dunaliella salina TaxID=3046 RepID=A0ABQ7G4H9_DUNSA|nr:hypothetical protein DUNSADRAFT_15977 [Dunaliella salina]|eukprot:KAF5829508.1 hypothetical protein DUNSADRAFT_15977 [Dunaliella salina]